MHPPLLSGRECAIEAEGREHNRHPSRTRRRDHRGTDAGKVDTFRGVLRLPDGQPGRHHCERGTAHAGAPARRGLRATAMGGGQLHADVRRLPADRRHAVRSDRGAARVHRGPHAVHRRIAHLWAGGVPGNADRRPVRAGARRGDPVAGVAGHDPARVRRPRQAHAGRGSVGGRGRGRRWRPGR